MQVVDKQLTEEDRPSTRSVIKAILTLLAIGVAVRAVLFFIYSPRVCLDTVGYVEMARYIQSGDFSNYQGVRTPIYPLIILICQFDYWKVCVFQAATGILISLMLFDAALRMTKSVWTSFWIGATQSLFINCISYEMALLSEATATFFAILSIWIYIRFCRGCELRVLAFFFLGFAVIGGTLTRPPMLLMAPIYFIFLAVRYVRLRAELTTATLNLTIFTVPILCGVFGWSAFNKHQVDYFGLSTMGGYNMCHHGWSFMQYAPDRFAKVRDICVEERDRNGSGILDVAYRLRQETGMTFAELSVELSKMSVSLYLHHPILYVKSAAFSWIHLWQVSHAFSRQAMRNPRNYSALNYVRLAQKAIQFPLNLAFVASFIYISMRRQEGINGNLYLVFFTPFIASVLQAGIETGDSRLIMPFQPMIMLALFVFAYGVYRAKKTKVVPTIDAHAAFA